MPTDSADGVTDLTAAFSPYGDPRANTITRRECPLCRQGTSWAACDGHGRPDGKTATGTVEATYTLLSVAELHTLAVDHRDQADRLRAQISSPDSRRIEPDVLAEWEARAAWHSARSEQLDAAADEQNRREQQTCETCSHLIVLYADGSSGCALCPYMPAVPSL